MAASMTNRKKKFSLFNRVHHEFLRAFSELLQEGKESDDLLSRLQMVQKQQIKQLSKFTVLFLVTSILVTQTAIGDTIKINSSLAQISLPKIYVVPIAAYYWWMTTISFLATVQYVFVEAAISNNVTKNTRFHAIKHHLTSLAEHDLSSPIRNGSLVKSSSSDHFVLLVTYIAPFLLALLPIIIALVGITVETFVLFSESSTLSIEWALAATVIGVIFFSSSYLIMYFTPMVVRKNATFIRWNFLFPLSNKAGEGHPRGSLWLDEEKSVS